MKPINWSKTDLSYSQLDGISLKKACLSQINLSNASLKGATFENVNFKKANLESADLRGARFIKCQFDKAQLKGVRAGGASFIKCTFKKADLSFGSFETTLIQKCSFIKTDLYTSDFQDADIEKSHFKKAHLLQSSLQNNSRDGSPARIVKTKFSQGMSGKSLAFCGLLAMFLLLAFSAVFFFAPSEKNQLAELRRIRDQYALEYREKVRNGQILLDHRELRLHDQIKNRLLEVSSKTSLKLSYTQATRDPELARLLGHLADIYLEEQALERQGKIYQAKIQRVDQLIFLARTRGSQEDSSRMANSKLEGTLNQLEFKFKGVLPRGIVEKTESHQYAKGVFKAIKKGMQKKVLQENLLQKDRDN